MAEINLRKLYPFYHTDLLVEVPDEVAEVLAQAERQEKNYIRRRYWNKAHYSLDAGDGIENHALFFALSPWEVFERELTLRELYAALDKLPPSQARRVYAHYILGRSKAEIARAEGVSKATVGESIDRGLRNLEILLKSSLA